MTVLRTTTVETDEDKIKREADRMDEVYDELSKFVSEHGPRLLTRGMSQIEAHEAILECLKYLYARTGWKEFGG